MKYPLLTKMIHDLAMDNDISQLPESEWTWPDIAQDLENQASLLTEEQRETLVNGEYTEVEELVDLYSIKELHDFLNEVFDGDLYDNFYEI